MRKVIFILGLTTILFACEHVNGSQTESKNSDSSVLTDVQINSVMGNTNEQLLSKYISQSKHELIRLSRKDEKWIFDRAEKTDTANYLIYQIGHDVSEEENTNTRFVTDQWIYIDSLKSKLYEYDLPNDSLIEWMN